MSNDFFSNELMLDTIIPAQEVKGYRLEGVEEEVDKTIQRRGGKWVVLDGSGKKVLGTHNTKREAQAQLRAIEASKRRRATQGKSDLGDEDDVTALEPSKGTWVPRKKRRRIKSRR